ncbi:MAG: MFS transporter [Gammaproteobacteria bacterium]|nr:MFS transporter [Gammaproteobacteria bacterium]
MPAPSQYRVTRDIDVWCLAVAETIIWAGSLYLFAALLPYWESELGWPKTHVAMVFSGALFMSALLSPTAGRLIDRDMGRSVLVLSATATAILLVAVSFTQSFALFACLWLAVGCCMAGSLYDPCFAYLVHSRGDNAKSAITLVTLVAGFAGTLAFPVNTYVAELYNWRASAQVFAGLIVCVALPCFWIGTRQRATVHETSSDQPPAKADDAAYKRARKTLTFWLLGLSFALMYLNHGTVITHLLPKLEQQQIPLEYAVFTISLLGPSQVAGRVLMIVLERWISMRAIAVISVLCLALAAIALVFASYWQWLLPVFAVLQGSGVGISSITRPVIIAELLGRESFGAIAGAIALPVMVAMAIASTVASGLWLVGGYDLVFALNILFALVAVAALMAALRIGPAPWAHAANNPAD